MSANAAEAFAREIAKASRRTLYLTKHALSGARQAYLDDALQR